VTVSNQAVKEKVYRAESRLAGLRLLVLATGSVIYPLLMDKSGTRPALAYTILGLSWAYSLYLYLAEPYRRYPVLISSWFTTVSDGAFTTLWVWATGAYASPFHLLYYPLTVAIAFRYGPRQTALAISLYAVAYFGLLWGTGALPGHGTEITVRITYMFLTGILGAVVSRELYAQIASKVEAEERIRQAAEREALEAQLRLADRLASVGTLAAGVAHEINNPLAYVVGNLDWIADELAAELGEASLAGRSADRLAATFKAVEQAQGGAQRVREIVRDLKTFSRADEDTRGPIDLARVLDASINLAASEIKARARLTREIAALPAVDANAARLGQVFLNLLINAAQALPEGQPAAHEVRVVARGEDGHAVVEVHDTGSGMTPEVMARIFDPFFTTKPVGVGTGLGLSICHGIVTRYGGRIEVTSEAGKGTTFRVLLPATEAEAAADPPPAVAAPLERAHVLVIDDEPEIGEVVEKLLSPSHTVEAMTSAKAALERLTAADAQSFDVILCDLMMPDMTGMELHEELSRRAPELTARMVFLTGGAFTPRSRQFLDGVSNRRLDKPFSLQELEGTVRELVLASPAQGS
jgi:signal transduction histidine kinase/CheY-like chemotaxis protein